MSISDSISGGLKRYGSTINERVDGYLASLGFTGALSDKLAKLHKGQYVGWKALTEELDVLTALASYRTQEPMGAFYLARPSVLGRPVLWQDSAGTVPVTQDGDPVGRMDDLSGNDNHAYVDEAVGKPLYRDGHFLEFNGTSHYFNLPLDIAQNVGEAYIAFSGSLTELSGSDNSMVWLSTGTGGTRARMNMRATSYLQAAGRRLDSDSFDAGAQVDVLEQGVDFTASAHFRFVDARVTLRKDGVEMVSTGFSTPGYTSDTPSEEAYIGYQAGEYTAMKARALFIGTGSLDIAPVEDFMRGLY